MLASVDLAAHLSQNSLSSLSEARNVRPRVRNCCCSSGFTAWPRGEIFGNAESVAYGEDSLMSVFGAVAALSPLTGLPARR